MNNLERLIADPRWRICNLYKIVDKQGKVVTFVPNDAQQDLLDTVWYRNMIPKARQRGISTVIQIAMLDACLFTDNLAGAIIAQDLDTAAAIFKKIKFAYENLPDSLRAKLSLTKETTQELGFCNGSSITVATSARGRTLQWLHISEFGKICAKNPERAREIITGSLPAVADDGMIFIESTAEGREGPFYDMVQEATRLDQAALGLLPMQYRLHFYSWWDAPEYEAAACYIEPKDVAYFDEIEAIIKQPISQRKRSWYVQKRRADFGDDSQIMFQEFPSTVEECFSVSLEGAYYTKQLARARSENRICKLPLLDSVPCNTFWDIGSSDGTAIWVHQRIGTENRFVRFYESWHQSYSHATQWLQSLGVMFECHYLPHDAKHVRQQMMINKCPLDMLQELLPGHKFDTVDRIDNINWGIQQCRDIFPTCYFDSEHCKAGVDHLDAYRKKWNEKLGCWSETPSKDGGHSEAADAYRQFAQGYQPVSAWGDHGKKKTSTPLTQYARSTDRKSTSKEWVV